MNYMRGMKDFFFLVVQNGERLCGFSDRLIWVRITFCYDRMYGFSQIVLLDFWVFYF